MNKGTIVTPNINYTRILNSEMESWLHRNVGKQFYVESVHDKAVRLKNVHFLITTDLLTVIKE